MNIDRLIEKIIDKKNPSVMGLDPKLELIPEFIKKSAIKEYGKTPKAAEEALFNFNKGLIDACGEYVPAIKPQSAYYEMYGVAGMKALLRTIEYAKKQGLCVILDVKRNDIGTTAEAYATAYLGKTDFFGEKISVMPADAVTVNPYLGTDGIKPFTNYTDSFLFALVKTSNKSGGELQDIKMENGKPYYYAVADMVKKWGEPSIGKYGYNAVGAVVGATYPEELNALREYMPNTFFLIPGYGAQGGAAKDICGAFDQNGIGAIVNSSRGIMYAYEKKKDPENYMLYAREAVLQMRDEFSDITLL
jgi:orotidine 5''-phosphate decarboxylase, subfamily 2